MLGNKIRELRKEAKYTQEELEIAINRGMEDVKAGRIVSHEDVLKYYMK